jgi:hypothetical protein
MNFDTALPGRPFLSRPVCRLRMGGCREVPIFHRRSGSRPWPAAPVEEDDRAVALEALIAVNRESLFSVNKVGDRAQKVRHKGFLRVAFKTQSSGSQAADLLGTAGVLIGALGAAPLTISLDIHVGIFEINARASLLMLTICVSACPAYPKGSGNIDLEKADSYACTPPSTYILNPGDPPFGKYVQISARYLDKRYLFSILYCQGGTFEFVVSALSALL